MILNMIICLLAQTQAMIQNPLLQDHHRSLLGQDFKIPSHNRRMIQTTDTQTDVPNGDEIDVDHMISEEYYIQEIEIGHDYQEFESKQFNNSQEKQLHPVKFFTFNIDMIYPGQDLFILMKAVSDHSTFPSLVLSNINIYPSLYNESDTVCGTYGLGVCSIAPENLQINQTYYLGVYCVETCDFGIKVSYQLEQVLQLGDSTVIKFLDSQSKLLKVHVPDTAKDIDRIIIRAHLVYGSQLEEAFYFYVNNGNENPSPIKNDFLGDEIWITGKGVVIHNNTQNTVTAGQNYTIVIVAPANTTVFLKSEFYGEVRTIYLFQIIDDIVGPGEINNYKLNIGSYYKRMLDKKDLSIDMHPYEGNPDLYISAPPQPKELKDYKWQSSLDVGYEAITLTTENRNDSSVNEYYLSVQGSNEMSSYSLMFYISDKSNRILSKYATESGFLSNKEIVHYNIDLQLEKTQNFTIEATFPQGQAILVLKKCMLTKAQEDNSNLQKVWDVLTADDNNFYTCNIKIKDVESYINVPIQEESVNQIKQSDDSFIVVSGGTIKFNYDQENCTTNAPLVELQYASGLKTRCRFVVAIVSTHADQTKFVLSLKGVDTHVELKAGLPVRSHLMQKDKDFYVFKIKTDKKDVTGVQFQFTVLNGDIEVWGSQVEKFPNNQNHTKYASYNLDVIEFVRNGTESMKGDYYLSVEAQSITTYTVTVILLYRPVFVIVGNTTTTPISPPVQPTYILLYEGMPQQISVHTKEQIQYFAFKVRQINQTTAIFINLEGIVGSARAFVIALKDGEINHANPSPLTNQWNITTTTRSLIIDPSDENFVSHGEYRIAVYPLTDEVVYEIQYSSTWTITPLHFGIPHYDSLQGAEIKYYEINFELALRELTITRTITTSNLQSDDDVHLYLSLNSIYPNNNTNDYALRGQNQKSLTLNFDDLNKAGCHSNQSCTLYLGAKSFGGYNEFTILIRGVHEPSQILEAISQVMLAPLKGPNEQIYFYYYMPKNKTVRIQTYSIYQELEIYANIDTYTSVQDYVNLLEHRDMLTTEEYDTLQSYFISQFPNETQYEFSSLDSNMFGSAVLISQAESSQECQDDAHGCVMLITVALDKKAYSYNFSQNYYPDGTFEIEASSEIETLRTGEPTIGYTQGGIMEFYKIEVRRPIGMIQIAVSPLDSGDPDIYVKYQDNLTEDHFPNTKDYDFNSISFKSDILLIQNTDKFFQNHTIEGVYIIGVYGFSKTKFSIEVTFNDEQIYNIIAGQLLDKIQLQGALEVQTNLTQDAFFKYNHVYDTNFRVIVQKSHGTVQIGINRHGNGTFWQTQSISLLDSLPYQNNSKAQWEANFKDRMFGGIIRVNKNDPNFCYICTYVIAVQNKNDEKTDISIVIGVDNQSIPLQSGKTLYDTAIKQGNYYSFNTDQGQAEFYITIYHGSAKVYIGDSLRSLPSKYITVTGEITKSEQISIVDQLPGAKVYLLVVPQSKQANYSLTAIDFQNNPRLIELSKSEEGQLEANELETFYYFSEGSKNHYVLFAQVSESSVPHQKNYQNVLPEIIVRYILNDDKLEQSLVAPKQQVIGESQIQGFYNLNKIDGYYTIQIKNVGPYVIYYQIVLNSADVNYMLPNQGLISKSKLGKKPIKFQIFMRESEKLYLEVFECLGNIALNFQNMTAKSELLTQKVFSIPEQIDSADFYFEVSAQTGLRHVGADHDEKEALYYIIPHLIPKESLFPTQVYHVGANGELKVELIDNDVVIRFSSVACHSGFCSSNTQKYPNLIIYSGHITNDQSFLEAFSTCNLQIDNVKQFLVGEQQGTIFHQKYFKLIKIEEQNLVEQPLNVTIDSSLLNQDQIYHLKILAKVYFNDSTTEHFTLEYNATKFRISNLVNKEGVSHQSQEKNQNYDQENAIDVSDKSFYNQKLFGYNALVVIGGAIFGFLTLLILIRYSWLKYRKTKFKQSNTRVKYDEEDQQEK